jgi:probable F420-dependent oxidoreductase
MGLNLGVGLFTGQIPEGSGRTVTQEYGDYLDLAETVEASGLDGVWVSEHHFAGDNYLPSLLPMLAAFAAVTERVALGTGVVLAPFHDPIRLAEDFAVVDHLSSGRVICGLGIGWRDEEFRAFNIEVKSRVRRLVEIVEILRKAWTGDYFDHTGRHYNYEAVKVTPKPAHDIPIFIGGFADEAVKRAGRIGDGYISSRAEPQRVAQTFELAAEEWSKAGKDGELLAGLLHNAFVTEDPDADWPMVRDGIGHQLGVYAGWRVGTDVKGKPLEVLPPDEETIRRTTAYGTPDEVIAKLGPIVDVLKSHEESHLIVRLHYPGMDKEPARRAIELFAKEVAPRLRERAAG